MDTRLLFDEDVINYDTYRPGYPRKLFDEIINYSSLTSQSHALEIGIGTGQATLPILETGCDVTAVELGENLAEYVREKYGTYGRFRVITQDFIDTPIQNKSMDLVYSATAFHWLPPEIAYLKVKDILVKGGTLALFWNHPFPNRFEDETNVINHRVYEKYRSSNRPVVEFSESEGTKRADMIAGYGFKDVEVRIFHRKRVLTAEDYIGLLNTYSDHRALPEPVRKAFEVDMVEGLYSVGGKINIYDTIDLYLART